MNDKGERESIMNKFNKTLYHNLGRTKFLILFSLAFSVLVNLLANLTIFFVLGSEIEMTRVFVYTIGYIVVGAFIGKIQLDKIENKK